MIKQNVGGVDKWIKIILGIILILIGYIKMSLVWGIIGLIIFLSGVAGRCLLYSLLGFSTCKKCGTTKGHNKTNKAEIKENTEK